MNPIDSLFNRLRAAGRKAFMPFLTAGDPDAATTVRVARRLIACGADLLEIGFPYSDPIADGPVIQASYTRTLASGIRVADVFALIRDLADGCADKVPLVGMVSFSLIHHRGLKTFLGQARSAGLSGLIVPDLPFEETDELADLAAFANMKLIQLVTPTTPPERAVQIADRSTGFLYCVSVTGITGEREGLPFQVQEILEHLQSNTKLPLCVGFGISKAEHVRLLRDQADGIIVGSAFVRRMERLGGEDGDEVMREIQELAKELQQALNPE